MKRLLIALSMVFFITAKAFGAPSNSMSITAPVDATVISASDETSRYNEITSKFNAHDHTDISQTSNDFTMNGPTPTLTLGDGTAEDTTILYDGNAQDFYIALDDSEDDLIIGRGSTVGTTPRMTISGDDDNPNVIFNNVTDGAHMRFTGDPTVSGAFDGDLWYTGSALSFRDGTTTRNLFGLSGAGSSTDNAMVRWDGTAGDTLQDTASLTVSDDGEMVNTLQPAFNVKPASTQQNIATDSGNITIIWGTVVINRGNNFASNTFTAPVTGLYQLNVLVLLTQIDVTATSVSIIINTSNQDYLYLFEPDESWIGDTQNSFFLSCLADMDASDTAIVTIAQIAGASQMDIATNSNFSGALLE